MLTAYADSDRRVGVVHLDVSDTTLRLALSFVAEDAGWTRGSATNADVIVTDQLHNATPDHPVGVLVVIPEPARCQAGVRAVIHGQAHALMSADDPEQLPTALDAAIGGYALMPTRLVDAANQVPPLDDRLLRTLLLVSARNSNASIARALHESESTAKRDVATLMRLFSVATRAELGEAATRLGFRHTATAARARVAASQTPAPSDGDEAEAPRGVV
ncbi:MAG: hypothetical protein QOI95_3096 [Acidimicrobiaceae bacterium]|jgi:DNA-binding NarL/FixJ family response regulator